MAVCCENTKSDFDFYALRCYVSTVCCDDDRNGSVEEPTVLVRIVDRWKAAGEPTIARSGFAEKVAPIPGGPLATSGAPTVAVESPGAIELDWHCCIRKTKRESPPSVLLTRAPP